MTVRLLMGPEIGFVACPEERRDTRDVSPESKCTWTSPLFVQCLSHKRALEDCGLRTSSTSVALASTMRAPVSSQALGLAFPPEGLLPVPSSAHACVLTAGKNDFPQSSKGLMDGAGAQTHPHMLTACDQREGLLASC